MISHRFDSTVLCGRCGEPVAKGADGFAVPHYVADTGKQCGNAAPIRAADRRLDTPNESQKSTASRHRQTSVRVRVSK